MAASIRNRDGQQEGVNGGFGDNCKQLSASFCSSGDIIIIAAVCELTGAISSPRTNSSASFSTGAAITGLTLVTDTSSPTSGRFALWTVGSSLVTTEFNNAFICFDDDASNRESISWHVVSIQGGDPSNIFGAGPAGQWLGNGNQPSTGSVNMGANALYALGFVGCVSGTTRTITAGSSGYTELQEFDSNAVSVDDSSHALYDKATDSGTVTRTFALNSTTHSGTFAYIMTLNSAPVVTAESCVIDTSGSF